MLDNANSFSDFFDKLGLCRKGNNLSTLKKIIKEYNLSTEQLDKNRKNFLSNCAIKSNKEAKKIEDILSNKVEFISSWHLLKKLVKGGLKEYKCEKCGIEEWNGEPISFQLHHKDGNRKNNDLNNLQVLCPNCHGQTKNYSGKKVRTNKKSQVKKEKESIIPLRISRKNLKDLIRKKSFVQIGKEFNVSDNTIRKWCKFYNLPYKTMQIKKYSDEDWKKV